jgi:hypothetical protein
VRYKIVFNLYFIHNRRGPHLVVFVSFYSCSQFNGTSVIDFCLGNWGYGPFVAEFLDQIWVKTFRCTPLLVGDEEGRFSLFKPDLLLLRRPFLTCHFFQQMQEIFGFEGQVTWGAAHDLKCYCLSPILKCLCNASKVRFSPPTYFSPPSICLADVAVSLIQSSSSFSYLNTSLDQYLPRSSSQCRPQVPASSPLPILRSTQQHAVNNLQHSTARKRTLVPVYVYPEHLAAIQQFLLTLGQPLVLGPDLAAEPEEVDVPASPLSEFQGAGGFDGGYSRDESEHDLTSSMSRLSLSSSYISLTPSTGSSTRRSHLFTSSRASPPSAARHSPAVSLQINTVPSLSRQASPTKKKYYSVTIGKKTGVFWDEW